MVFRVQGKRSNRSVDIIPSGSVKREAAGLGMEEVVTTDGTADDDVSDMPGKSTVHAGPAPSGSVKRGGACVGMDDVVTTDDTADDDVSDTPGSAPTLRLTDIKRRRWSGSSLDPTPSDSIKTESGDGGTEERTTAEDTADDDVSHTRETRISTWKGHALKWRRSRSGSVGPALLGSVKAERAGGWTADDDVSDTPEIGTVTLRQALMKRRGWSRSSLGPAPSDLVKVESGDGGTDERTTAEDTADDDVTHTAETRMSTWRGHTHKRKHQMSSRVRSAAASGLRMMTVTVDTAEPRRSTGDVHGADDPAGASFKGRGCPPQVHVVDLNMLGKVTDTLPFLTTSHTHTQAKTTATNLQPRSGHRGRAQVGLAPPVPITKKKPVLSEMMRSRRKLLLGKWTRLRYGAQSEVTDHLTDSVSSQGVGTDARGFKSQQSGAQQELGSRRSDSVSSQGEGTGSEEFNAQQSGAQQKLGNRHTDSVSSQGDGTDARRFKTQQSGAQQELGSRRSDSVSSQGEGTGSEEFSAQQSGAQQKLGNRHTDSVSSQGDGTDARRFKTQQSGAQQGLTNRLTDSVSSQGGGTGSDGFKSQHPALTSTQWKLSKLASSTPNLKKAHICRVCGKGFLVARSLLFHWMSHTGNKPHKCQVCQKSFTCLSVFNRHRRRHSEHKPHVCAICQRAFVFESDLKQHQKLHDSEKHFTCPICKAKFRWLGNFRRHERTHTDLRLYSCGVCGKTYRCWKSLQRHEVKHSGVKPHRCPVCLRAFWVKQALKKHSKIHAVEESFTCEQCGRRYVSKANLVRHMTIHGDSKTFNCKICGETFTSNYFLTQHNFIHRDESQLACRMCRVSFSSLWSLKRHICKPKATDTFSLFCCFCKDKFVEILPLVDHMAGHSEEKVMYTCELCRAEFYNRAGFVAHLEMHAGKKSLQCNLCDKKFNRIGGLKTHMVHHAGKRVPCSICNKSLSVRTLPGHLKRHMKKEEGSNMDTGESSQSVDKKQEATK